VEEKANKKAIMKQLARKLSRNQQKMSSKLRKPFLSTKIKFLRLMAEFIFLLFKRDI
jgi:hypothetical protein